MNNLKILTEEQIKQMDKIMETEAFIEFLEDALSGHLTTETRDRYRNQLKTAKNRLTKLEKKFREGLEEFDNGSKNK